MQCVILAGGLGTRMWPDARTIPKTLLPVARRPFADWQLEWLSNAGVSEVVYCIGYLGQMVVDHVGDGARFGLSVRYSDEGTELRGTAGALRLALDADLLESRFLILYGDSWLQVDPRRVFASAESSRRPALMTVFENVGSWDASNVVYENGVVTRYEKGLDQRPPEMRWIDYGLSVLDRELIASMVPPGEQADLAPLMTTLANDGRLAGYLVTDRFYEIGSPAGLTELEELLRDDESGSSDGRTGLE